MEPGAGAAERLHSSRLCSGSGRATAPTDGRCAGSRKSFEAARRKRAVLYEPVLRMEPARPHHAAGGSQNYAAETSRRRALQLGGAALLTSLAAARSSQAISMPQAMDDAWSAIGGGPADLYFDEAFLGRWRAESTLVSVETPLGPDFVPNPQVVERARQQDLQQKIAYQVSYIRNKKGKVIIDRRFNTASLMGVYMGRDAVREEGVLWDPEDPNRLSVQLPGGLNIVTRVVRRSVEKVGSDRINTSEYFEQVFQTPGKVEPRVKASRCYTKYKWRSEAQAAQSGGPQIVATQVVSDYLTPYDGERLLLQSRNRPVVIYTYQMAFRRAFGSLDA